MQKDNLYTFDGAFRNFLKNEKIDVKYREKLLVESWEILMGKPISSRTNSIFLSKKTLFVELSSAPLKQELINNKQKVINILSKDFDGLFDDVKFI